MPLDVAVWNERVKLAASALNTLATAAIAAGVLTQVAAVTFDLPTQPSGTRTTAGLAAWLLVGLYLHATAHWVLGKLRE